jgi:transposase
MDGKTLFDGSSRTRSCGSRKGWLVLSRAAAQFGVGVNTAILWVRRFRETGSVAPGQMGGHKPKKISGKHRDWLLERTKARDFTLRGLVAELAERGLKVDYRSVWEFVHAENLSFKKTVVASERDRPDVARRRAQWQKYQGQIDPERLVFIDETWTKTNMATLRGWAPCGTRLTAKVPHGHWKPHCATIGSRHHGFSMARSTVRASQSTSRRFCSRP